MRRVKSRRNMIHKQSKAKANDNCGNMNREREEAVERGIQDDSKSPAVGIQDDSKSPNKKGNCPSEGGKLYDDIIGVVGLPPAIAFSSNPMPAMSSNREESMHV
ncbi:hypothetical protein Adt_12814 [Abeliophyllum distichum]|uniref:Uncharacterized protein n=1 Tax=Abeliophyllum distichum TaxID=126358 RepID=A0ABD1URU3_9LAMI